MPRSLLLSLLAATSILLTALPAMADDCPPGSLFKNQDGFSFCEPTVCVNDGMCNPNEVCRPVPLCMQVGALTTDASSQSVDASKRLVVTQRCGPDKQCPQSTVCSDMSRCITKAQADKMGLLNAGSSGAGTPGTSPAASSSAAPTEGAAAKKSACGCEVVGSPARGFEAGLSVAALAAMLLLRKRRIARDPGTRHGPRRAQRDVR